MARIRQIRCRATPVGAVVEVVGAALHGADRAVVVDPERVGPGQHLHVGVGGEFRGDPADPVAGGRPVDLLVGAEQGTAGCVLVVEQDHPGTGAGGGLRGGEPGRSGADDQHVGVRVLVVVAGGVGGGVQAALPGQAVRDQAVGQRHGGGGEHGFGVGVIDLDQRVGVFQSGGHDAARAAVDDAGGDLVDTVGQQGRGQGVAAVARSARGRRR